MTDKKQDGVASYSGSLNDPVYKTFKYTCMANDERPSTECIQILSQVMDQSFNDLKSNEYYAIASWFSKTYAP